MSEVAALEKARGPHHSVSLTGGEPLLYADFLRIFLKLLREHNLKSYLETNGTLPEDMRRVIDLVDIIAMDFKLPSSTLGKDFWKEHLEFLKVSSGKKVFVKAVVTATTTDEDIEKAAGLIKRVSPSTPFILQPATPVKGDDKTVAPARLIHFMDLWAGHNLDNIRVIPQVHKMLNVK